MRLDLSASVLAAQSYCQSWTNKSDLVIFLGGSQSQNLEKHAVYILAGQFVGLRYKCCNFADVTI